MLGILGFLGLFAFGLGADLIVGAQGQADGDADGDGPDALGASDDPGTITPLDEYPGLTGPSPTLEPGTPPDDGPDTGTGPGPSTVAEPGWLPEDPGGVGPGASFAFGTGGDDTLAGSSGSDRLFALGGDDSLDGLAGDDTLAGGNGDDTVSGGDGSDDISGGAGNDVLDTGDGHDIARGGAGDDMLTGGLGDARLFGGEGNDLLRAGGGPTELWGDGGDDTLIGGAGTDVLDGGAGNDLLISATLDPATGLLTDTDALDAEHRVAGGDGDDTLILGASDTGTGGEGADTFVAFHGAAAAATVADFDASTDRLAIVYDPLTNPDPQITTEIANIDDLRISLDGTPVITLRGAADSFDTGSVRLVTSSQEYSGQL